MNKIPEQKRKILRWAATQWSKNRPPMVIATVFALGGVFFMWQSFAANPNLPADLNNDNVVNLQDLSMLLSNFNKTATVGDLNSDGQVTIIDLSTLLTSWGRTATPNPNPPTPNPPTPNPPNPNPFPIPNGPTYYVDCQNGNDSNSGTSEQQAIKSLGKASSLNLKAGENLLLKSGCKWSGESLEISESGTASARITVGRYGEGARPILESNKDGMNIVRVSGSYVTVQSLSPRALPPRTVEVSNCRLPNNVKTANLGHVVGIQLGGSNNIAQDNETHGGYSGVQISGGNNNKVLHNRVLNADFMDKVDSGGDNDAGAFAIHVYESNNSEIGYNFITGALACSFDYVADGGAIEFYDGGSGLIHHNVVENSDAFTEVGCGSGSGGDMTFAYNTFNITLQKGLFFYAHSGGKFGCDGTNFKFFNNTIYQPNASERWSGVGSSSGSMGVSCKENCTAKNNIIIAPASPLGSGGTVSNNLINPDPAAIFVNAAAGDFKLKAGSEAIDAGVCDIASQPYGNKDMAGVGVPIGGKVDLGAYEFGSGPAGSCN